MACRPTVRSSVRHDAVTCNLFDDQRGHAGKRTTETWVQESSLIMELPSELIFRIFSRLPLKSVLQCRVVCRQWCKLLKDQYFFDVYSKNPPYSTFLLPLRSDVLRKDGQLGLYLIEISKTNGDCIQTPFNQRLPISVVSPSNSNLIGSCNGLLCFNSYEERVFHIWNPIIGKSGFISVPQEILINREFVGLPDRVYNAFGYSSAVDKFKLLQILVDLGRSPLYLPKVEGKIFTLGVDKKWRRLPDSIRLCDCPHDITTGITFNGVFHWLSEFRYNEHIHTFDLGEEKKGLVSWPCSRPVGEKYVHSEWLIVSNDELSVIQIVCHPRKITIWSLKKYGVAESWTRIDILDACLSSILDHFFCKDSEYCTFTANLLRPAAILMNGDIILTSPKSRGKLVFYDPRLHEVTKTKDFQNANFWNSLIPYAPTFAPRGGVLNAQDDCKIRSSSSSTVL